MRTNIKALQLIEKGLSSKTVSKLTESQINVLHSKLLGEASVTVSSKNPNAAEIAKQMVAQDVNVTMAEKEIDEDDTLDVVKDPDATEDGMGIFEEDKDNPKAFAICHTQVGPKKSRKWERCVKEVKKQLGEGKNPVSLFLESQIQKIVEKHMPPKITKGDLVRYISEQGTAPSPTTKPAPTKPGVSPGKRPRPAHPGKNPNPGENPAPKAKKVSPEDAKEKVIDVIMQLLEK
jgi:hypothetical protein